VPVLSVLFTFFGLAERHDLAVFEFNRGDEDQRLG
jgi:hypothetical protein